MDRTQVIDNAFAAGVQGIVLADFDAKMRPKLLELATSKKIHASLGLHPWAVFEDTLSYELELLDAAVAQHHHGIVAIGECGLDFVRTKHTKAQQHQQRALVHQLTLANQYGLPIVLHAVKSHQQCIQHLKSHGTPFMIHAFESSQEMARQYLQLIEHNVDVILSFGPTLTRGRSKKVHDAFAWVVEHYPDHFTFETDAPDRPPAPYERGEPLYLLDVCQAAMTMVQQSEVWLAARAAQNVKRFLNLPVTLDDVT